MIIYLLRIVIFPRYRGKLLIADSQPNMGHELRAMLKQNELYIFRIGPCGPDFVALPVSHPVSMCSVYCIFYRFLWISVRKEVIDHRRIMINGYVPKLCSPGKGSFSTEHDQLYQFQVVVDSGYSKIDISK